MTETSKTTENTRSIAGTGLYLWLVDNCDYILAKDEADALKEHESVYGMDIEEARGVVLIPTEKAHEYKYYINENTEAVETVTLYQAAWIAAVTVDRACFLATTEY